MKNRLIGIIIVLLVVGSMSLFSQTPVIWVYDNNDPDYETPPFEDTLTCLGTDGTVLWSISQFNICQAIGDDTKIVADPVSGCWLVEIVGGRLIKVDSDGQIIVDQNVADTIAVAISDDGQNLYTAIGHTINDSTMSRFDSNGILLGTTNAAGGFDIVFSPFDNRVIGVSHGIYKVSHDLATVDWSDTAEFGWSAVSVDTRHSDGTIWVAEREYSPGYGNDNVRMYNASGILIQTIPIGKAPWSVAVSQSDGSCYVGTHDETLHYDASGSLIDTIPTGAFSIAIDDQENVWLAGSVDASIHKYSSTGVLLWSSPAIFSNDQKGIAFGYIDGTPPNNPPSVTDLSVDGKPGNPDNVSTYTPEFSWIFGDVDAGDTQSAFQIQVGSTSGASDFWDYTGTTASSVVYNGNDLPANTTIYWQIRVEDQEPASSGWVQGTFQILDIGLRAFDGTDIIKIAVDHVGPSYTLRICKDGTIYGIILVNPSDQNASKLRIQTPSGIKALKKM